MSLLLFLLLVALPTADSVPADTTKGAKSPVLAVGISAANVIGPLFLAEKLANSPGDASVAAQRVLITYGLIVGPAIGHIYAGRPERASDGVMVRMAFGGASTLGIFLLMRGGLFAPANALNTSGTGLFVFGSIALLTSIFFDVGEASRSAEIYNQGAGLSQMHVTPLLYPGGVGLRAAF